MRAESATTSNIGPRQRGIVYLLRPGNTLRYNLSIVQKRVNRKVMQPLYQKIYTLDMAGYIRVFQIARTQYVVHTNSRTTTCVMIHSIKIM